MIVYYNISQDAELTEEQKREIKEATKMPIVYDEDSPEMTPEMYEVYKQAALERKHRIKG